MLYAFFQENAEGKAVPMAERTALTLAVRNYVIDTYGDYYESYNRELCENALSYEIYQIYEGMPQVLSIVDPKLNLKTTPDKWRPRD